VKIPHPFLISISILSIGRGVHRQDLRIYFPWLCNDLGGKAAKWGVDKILGNRDIEAGLAGIFLLFENESRY
jgi:hypothetical protein